jgi:hypothetical protein
MIEPHQQEILQKHVGSIPVRVGLLADELGLEVVLSALSPNISGMIEPSDTAPSGFKIRINKFEGEERQRFTIAHEIAHYLLHREHIHNGIVDNALYRSGLSSAKETQANKLAADIVMPYSKVMAELNELGGKRDAIAAEALARKFRVSSSAMRVRLGIK